MKRLAIILTFLLIFPIAAPAQSLQGPESPASECPGLARACTAAARELIAARKLIAGYESHIAAADERIRIADRQIVTLREKGALETLRAKELENVIATEREQIKILLGKIDLQEKRIKQLDKQAKRARKLALITTVAAAVGILIAVAK